MRNVCLNLVSEFSTERGTASVSALLDRARQARVDIVGLVDRATLLGAAPFLAEARRRDLGAVVGVEFEVASMATGPASLESLTAPETYPLVLIAESAEGRTNLSRLVSLAHTRAGGGDQGQPAAGASRSSVGRPGVGRPFLLVEDLLAHHHGLIAQSPGLVGEVSSRIQRGQADLAERLALRLVEVFGRSAVYLGISLHGLPAEARHAAEVVALAHRVGVPVVASDRVDHLDEDDRVVRNARLAVAHDRPLVDVARDRFLAPDSRFRTPAERRRLYRDHPEALDNEVALAERAVVREAPAAPVAATRYPMPNGRTADDYLASIVEVRCPTEPRYRERLLAELAEAARRGLSGWFLIQWDAVRYGRRHGLRIEPAGGALRSSLIAHFLGLTDIDPVAVGLDAAHFFAEAVTGAPEMTFRLPAGQRAELAAYLEHRHGRERVHHPALVQRLSPRAAVRLAGGVLGVPDTDVAAAMRHVTDAADGDVARAVARDEHLARRYVRESDVRAWLDLARGLSGLVGSVEADRDARLLDTDADWPTAHDAHGRAYVEWSAESIESEVIPGALARPVLVHLHSVGPNSGGPAAPPRRDREEAITEASLEHVARLQPAVAARYTARASGVEPTPILEARLQPILARTHGLLLEEEQLAGMARVLAGFDPFEAESFRRALTRPVARGDDAAETRRVADRRDWRLRFLDGAVAQGLEPDRAEAIFTSLSDAAPRLADRADSVERARRAAPIAHESVSRSRSPVRSAATALAADHVPASPLVSRRRPAVAQLSMPWTRGDEADPADARRTGTYGK